MTEQTKEQTKEQIPAHEEKTENFSLDFVLGWNADFPKTVNSRTSQIEDQNAIQVLLAEGRTPAHLVQVRAWMKANGKAVYWSRPRNLLDYSKGGAGTRVIDLVEMEMDADQQKIHKASKNGHSSAPTHEQLLARTAAYMNPQFKIVTGPTNKPVTHPETRRSFIRKLFPGATSDPDQGQWFTLADEFLTSTTQDFTNAYKHPELPRG